MPPNPTQEAVTCPSCRHVTHDSTNFCPKCGADVRGLASWSDTFQSGVRTVKKPQPAPPELIGQTLVGRYRVLARIGEGGMGSVYKVEHVRMGKVMALKLMRGEFTSDTVAVERFVSEAKIVSRLTHVHTISVFDFGELEDGSLFLAMEYVPGEDLAGLLERERRLPWRRAAAVVSQVLRSLAEAHDAGVVHRDVKPGNVMLLRSREGEDFAKVLDFGIAKLAEKRAGEGKPRTGSGEFVGTPNYMAPEQCQGKETGPAADLYATGAMLFELVTGQIPFDGPTPVSILMKHVQQPPPRPSESAPEAGIPDALDEVILRALAKEPQDRWQSADEMRVALENAVGLRHSRELHVVVPPTTGGGAIASREDWDSFERSLRRGMGLRNFIAGFVVLLALGGAGAAYVKRDELGKVLRAPTVRPTEQEPNGTSGDANLMALDKPITGTMTGRFDGKGDVDTLELPLPPGEHLVRVTLSPIPDMNLVLVAFDAAGKPLAKIDERKAGEGETATNLPGQGRIFLQLRQNTDGGSPRENTQDAWTLVATLDPPDAGMERERNDDLEAPSELPRGEARRGIAGGPGARDVWALPGEGLTGVLVTGAGGADLGVRLVGALEAPPKKLVDAAPAGGGELVLVTDEKTPTVLAVIDVVGGVEHVRPYEVRGLYEQPAREVVAAIEGRLHDAHDPLDAMALASRAVKLFPGGEDNRRLVALQSEAAGLAAAAVTEKLRKDGLDVAARDPLVTGFSRLGHPLFLSPGARRAWPGAKTAREAVRALAAGAEDPGALELGLVVVDAPCGAAAASERARAFLARYPGTAARPEALLLLGQAQVELSPEGGKLRNVALQTLDTVVLQHPGSPAAEEAAALATKLRQNEPAPSFFPCEK